MAKSKSELDASAIWDRLCEFVREDDGLPVYPCGGWTIDKLHFLCRYLAVTTNAIKENRKFTAINYIDLFCGNGVCVAPRDSVIGKRYPGSALLAAACPKCFHNLYLADSNPANIKAVNARISNLGYEGQVHTFECDANNAVDKIVDMIPSRSLSVAFIDPFRLDGITYDALRTLATGRRVDLIILFADAMDAVRNIKLYLAQPNGPLDRVLGESSNWRQDWKALANRSASNVRHFFRSQYMDQIRKLGYTEFDAKTVTNVGKPLYCLLYASKNPLGLKFWHIAIEQDRSGERNLWTM